jgi:hypothetical protein
VSQLEKLIIVAGHAAFNDSIDTVPEDPADSRYWVLQSFQQNEPPYYIEHIQKGVELLKRSESSLLLFSGGRTRREAGHWSEAATYRAIAERYNYWSDDATAARLMGRTAMEVYARDSFENLKFGLCRFYELEGRYPDHVTVVGWLFKAARFRLHSDALGIPAAKFTYVGCNSPDDLPDAMRGEAKAIAQFREDPIGEKGILAKKRSERNPFNEQPSYDCPPIGFS